MPLDPRVKTPAGEDKDTAMLVTGQTIALGYATVIKLVSL
jgi:hypothetical protein